MSTIHTSVQEKLNYIRQLLEAGKPEQALHFLEKTGVQTPELQNALGVCLLRSGNIKRANDVLRELVFQKAICIPYGTPPLFQANYVTSLLMRGNYNQAAIEILKGLSPLSHPYVAELYQTLHRWQQKLPLVKRILYWVKLYPSTPVTLTVPPGSL